MTSPYRWPQFVRQQLCSISYSFAARWRKLVRFSFFYRKFVCQQPEVVESRIIAHFDGFLMANTIKWKNFECRSKVTNYVKYSKITFSYIFLFKRLYLCNQTTKIFSIVHVDIFVGLVWKINKKLVPIFLLPVFLEICLQILFVTSQSYF